MPTTVPLGFRYPPPTGVSPNVPRDLQYLAEDVQGALGDLAGAILQDGVIDAGSFQVTQASGGASMTLDIASNVGRGAFVKNTSTGALLLVKPTGAKSTVTVGTAHASNPRVDRVVVDTTGIVYLVSGTASSGATLDNLTGAPAVPASTLLLADLLVPALDTTISNSQIRDRRKWARGVSLIVAGNGSGDFTTTDLGGLELTYFTRRVECSGAPMLIEFFGNLRNNYSSQTTILLLDVDGANVSQFAGGIGSDAAVPYSAPIRYYMASAGSHTVRIRLATSSGTGTLRNTSTNGIPSLVVREIVAQNSANNTTTTG